MRHPLPLDDHIPAIRAHLARHRALVVTAAPGSGKTTRLPPALLDAGPLILLQPRRVAARAIARRIAEERGWTVGQDVGWHIRLERSFGPATRLLVVTEGILTARLQQDPLLSTFATVVLDEFHERSIHADVGLALAKQAWLARADLRIVVMSATLDGEAVSAYLDGCPVLTVEGHAHPLEVDYAPEQSVAEAVSELAPATQGTILVFLPGAREIAQAQSAVAAHAAALALDVVPLHGSMEGSAQDDALRASPTRRVILATNIAETSLTVPGVSTVVDTGLVKVARYDARRGVDSLTLERVTADAATQRAGRAARLGPGRVRRLWHATDKLRPSPEAEVSRTDLAGPVLDLLAWGADLRTFDWFERPPADRIEAAVELLRRLGTIEGSAPRPTITSLGRRLQRLPLHPRLARILLEGGGSVQAAAACVLLSTPLPQRPATTSSCDLLPLLDDFARQPAHVRRLANELTRLASAVADTRTDTAPASLERALFAGYADRVARRRPGSLDRFTLASGHGARLGRESGVRDAEFIVALDILAEERDGVAEARISAASRVDRAWLHPTRSEVRHWVDAETGRVRAARVASYEALVLSETPVAPDPERAAALLCEGWMARGPAPEQQQMLNRARFAGLSLDVEALVAAAARSAGSLTEIDLERALPFDVREALARLAPASMPVPSGRTAALTYRADGSVSASVKLQELFGLADSPRFGPRRVPVTFFLLAPNGRPVQTTQDLRSFWQRTYPEVRKELRGRYPKHPWPEDPWSAPATHRTTRRPDR